jgi:hypothetical protein
MVIVPVLLTSPPSRVNQIESISPGPSCSAITQPAELSRRQENEPSKPSRPLPSVRSKLENCRARESRPISANRSSWRYVSQPTVP